MRRSPVLLLTAALALATGLALLRVAEQLASPAPAAGVDDANAAVVRRFYAAVNAALRSGDVDEVERLVDPDFVGHAPPPGLPPTRAGLVAYLLALHATFPAMELAVEEVLARGDVVIARVRVEGAEGGTFLGLALPDYAAAWGPFDAFRVIAGRIAAYWGGDEVPVLLAPGFRVTVAVPSPNPVVALARFTYAPGERREHVPLGPLVLAVEAGTLAVGGDHPGGPQEPPGGGREALLGSGDRLAVPAGARAVLHNPGPGPASFLGVALIPANAAAWSAWTEEGAGAPLPAEWWPAPFAPGSRFEPLASGTATGLRAGVGEIALGRATLAPGAGLRIDEPGGTTAIAVEAGAGGLALGAGHPSAADEPGEARLLTGDGRVVPAGVRWSVYNADAVAVVVLVVAVLPAEPEQVSP